MNTDLEFQICRLCGFVRKVQAGTACPACGAPPTTFRPYQYKAAESRRKYLELDIHPILVHFTIGYALSLALLFVLSLITPEFLGIPLRDEALSNFFIRLLPLFVGVTGLTGLIDGKIRFRKLQTQFLRLKMVLGTILLVASVLLLVTHLSSAGGQGTDSLFTTVDAMIIIVLVLLVSLLGWFGSKLTGDGPIVPRGIEKS